MQFHQALIFTLDQLNISTIELAKKLCSNPRWIKEITTNSEWKPKFDTVLRICYSLNVEVESFLNIAEFGIDGNQLDMQRQNAYSDCHKSVWAATPSQNIIILNTQPCHISQTLRLFRKEKGITQRQLEQKTAFSKNTISFRESDRYQNYPTVTTLEIYCYAFNISLSDFVHQVFSFVIKELEIVQGSRALIQSVVAQKCTY